MIEGLTIGEPSYDGIFVLRNPEHCNLIEYSLNKIPIYMEKRMKMAYDACIDFFEASAKHKIVEYTNTETIKLKDFSITSFIINSSNLNTHILRITDTKGKSIVVCGDFKNYDTAYRQDKLREAIEAIAKTDCVVIDGKYLGRKRFRQHSKKRYY